MWMMRPGLDGAADTVSFEAVGRPGWFISAAAPPGEAAAKAKAQDNPATCVDAKEVDCGAAVPDGCGTNACEFELRTGGSAGPVVSLSVCAHSSPAVVP